MPAFGEARMAELLQPYVEEGTLPSTVLAQLNAYLDLLLRWNAHTNLTAISGPEELVQRQIGESLFAARFVTASGSLLDFGSGAGFPGIPLQILRPELRVTLAECQGKKASFLREVVRSLALPSEIWAKRVEQMPPSRTFDTVTMRAVDATQSMLPFAEERVGAGGTLLRYLPADGLAALSGWDIAAQTTVPRSSGRLVSLTRIQPVERS